MARTGARPRHDASRRPKSLSPSARAPSSSRGRSRPAVGRRRRGRSPVSASAAWLFRPETLGLALILLAVVAVVWTVPLSSAPDLRHGIVRTFGLHVFSLALTILAVGWLTWRRRIYLLVEHPRVDAALVLGFIFSAGAASLLSPDWHLASTSLADVSAGGDFGRLLTGSIPGALVWLLSGLGFAADVWPGVIAAAVAGIPDAAATVWSWRIPQRAFAGTLTVLDFVFPTKTPVDEEAQHTPPAWLPPEPAVPTAYEGVGLPPAIEEEVPPPDRAMRQVELPIAWEPSEGEEQDERPLAPVALSGWELPPMDLLAPSAPPDESARPDNALRAGLIVETLASFGVDAQVVQINEGPVVTQFGVEPGWEVKYRQVPERDKDGRTLFDKDGKPRMHSEEVSRTRVRVNQITTLQNDLALALAAPSIRIEAPVPGKPVVGIEVPNTAASVVTLRSVIETPAFQRMAARSRLTLALGKGVSGEPVVADLAKAPHLLIAGATGSGKSVCINTIIMCLLMHAKPEEVRFVMIDPKRVELSSFAMIPHLAFSNIITDVEKVVGTLGAVLHEMESRYKRFASLAVRNIDAYNRHPRVAERMPYWVVIIDELADLMMAAPFEVERQICRLAQLARATGIHLIVATQRPSVDVVTGLIKANFPTRIAFAMSSQVDSRTILDMAGAERLLGRGDMLYMPTDAAKPKRLQGVYVSDAEIDRVVAFWAQERVRTGASTPVYDHLFEQVETQAKDDADDDPMYERAKALAVQHSRVSTSLLQRRLRIGYPRAARLMDMLEEEGVVSGADGGGSREVLAREEDEDEVF